MTINIKIFLLCPIPDGQKPISEYITYKDNFLTTLINSPQKEKIFLKWYFFILLFFFSFSFLSDFINFSLSLIVKNFLLTNLIILCFYFTNFIKWKILQKRFQQSRIIYEEGSWYDSQIWEKPFLLIKNDKLIENQKIKPIIQQLFRTFLRLTYFNIFLIIILINIK